MEAKRVDILNGPSKEEVADIYRAGSKKDVCFEIQYGFKRTAFVDILEVVNVEDTYVKMLASMPAGFFVYSQGEDPRPDHEKLEKINVHIFYTTNSGKGYIEKVTGWVPDRSGDSKKEKEEPRTCPRCKGSKVDPHHFQDDCQRCGGTGKVYGDESKWTPPQFVD